MEGAGEFVAGRSFIAKPWKITEHGAVRPPALASTAQKAKSWCSFVSETIAILDYDVHPLTGNVGAAGTLPSDWLPSDGGHGAGVGVAVGRQETVPCAKMATV